MGKCGMHPGKGIGREQSNALRISWLLLAVSIAVFRSSEGFAQSEAEGGAIIIPEVLVEEKIMASAQKAITDKRQAPNSMTVIEFDQLNQFGDQPLGDAMRRLPAMTFPGGNRARDIQLRGIGVQYTQVLVNGRPLMDGNSSRSVQVDRIPSSLVERIEIVRSPLANQDGQGTAGTVNIILRNQRFDKTRQFGVGGGYLDKNGEVGDSTLVFSDEKGPLRFSLTGGVQRQRRNESKSTYSFTGNGTPNAGVLEGNERRFDQINLVPAFELAAGSRDVFRFEPSYLRTEESRDDIQRDLVANQSSVQRTEFELRNRVRENYGLFSSWTHTLSETTKWTAGVDLQQAREDTARDATRFTAAGVIDRTRQRTEDIDLGGFARPWRSITVSEFMRWNSAATTAARLEMKATAIGKTVPLSHPMPREFTMSERLGGMAMRLTQCSFKPGIA
ncbi:MAG: TonB-dependent receptor plug domain-containing protein [Nitrospiraceae bacterium]